MNSVTFFDEKVLRSWIGVLQHSGIPIRLPAIDQAWFEQMISCVEVTKLRPQFQADLHLAASSIFYKVIKNHYRVDGNKRSAVICSYLFYIVNGYHLSPPQDDLYEFARAIAESKKNYEDCLPEIRDFFVANAKKSF